MHGQLCKTDVNGVQGQLSSGNIAESGAAEKIGTIVKYLNRNPGDSAELLHDGSGNRICRVFLIRTVFDYNAAV